MKNGSKKLKFQTRLRNQEAPAKEWEAVVIVAAAVVGNSSEEKYRPAAPLSTKVTINQGPVLVYKIIHTLYNYIYKSH